MFDLFVIGFDSLFRRAYYVFLGGKKFCYFSWIWFYEIIFRFFVYWEIKIQGT
jgi:hypothetical protein